MFHRLLGVIVSAAALFVAGCSPPGNSAGDRGPFRTAELKPESARKKAPSFVLQDANGQKVRLEDFNGKVVLLNFWATWCGPCKLETPWFVEFQTRFRDQGLVVLGVSMDEDGWDAVKPFMEKYKVNYRVVMGDDITAQLYGGVEALPTTFLIDRGGRVASVHQGLISKGVYEKEIIQLLQARQDAGRRAAVLAAGGRGADGAD